MQKEEEEGPIPSSSPNPSPLLRDISNFKTPKPPTQNPNLYSPSPLFFTASKETPSYSASSSAFLHRRGPSLVPSSSRSKAARKLKAFELEQSQSSRKAQIRRKKTLKSLSNSLSTWLSFLLENPTLCGCDLEVWNGEQSEASDPVSANGKRDGRRGGRLGVDRAWRSPKRQRNCLWKAPATGVGESVSFSLLQLSLKEVCSFEDLRERMGACLNTKSCNEVLSVMSQVAKNVDEGRLKMKAHCPTVTDVALKEKATRVLMCYNPTWLRIGLHIVFGGDSLLPIQDLNTDEDDLFLKMIIEKQFFSHACLAKSYAYNKLVEGLYRPGYFEALGNVILKRFLLLVLLLDKAKCQSMLPIKYGIDGIDGGSPLLFSCHSYIKSSRQVIHEFLSEAMHGEGDLLAHLVTLGYKLSYQQSPLVEYDFKVKDLFEDLQDGVRLCRATQLLLQDASILSKVVVPSDTRKKNIQNCGLVIQCLRHAGVSLSDEDGVLIVAEDIASADKELLLSLLWNMFIFLQLPLLINKTLLAEEISKVKGSEDFGRSNNCTHMDMLLEWVQEICKIYDIKVDSFSSLVDGKALCCLIDYYFGYELHGYSSFKNMKDAKGEDSIILSKTDKTVVSHNFIFIQRVTMMLGNFPEVLTVSDFLEHDAACNERTMIILLVFLSSQLIDRKNMDNINIHKLMEWNLDKKHSATVPQLPCSGFTGQVTVDLCPENSIPNFEAQSHPQGSTEYNIEDTLNNIKIIQSWWQSMSKRNQFLRIKMAVSIIQKAVRCHLADKHITEIRKEMAAKVIQSHFRGLTERHNYLKIKSVTSFLQTVIRAWLTVNKFGHTLFVYKLSSETSNSSDIFQRFLKFMIERHNFLRIQKSVLLIQKATRTWITRRHQKKKLSLKAIGVAELYAAVSVIQAYIRGQITRSKFILMVSQSQKTEATYQEQKALDHQMKAIVTIQLAWKRFRIYKLLSKQRFAATKVQSHWRHWLMRRKAFEQSQLGSIQFSREQNAQNKLLGASYLHSGWLRNGSFTQMSSSCVQYSELEILLDSVVRLQRWWKKVLLHKSRTGSAIVIQSRFRGWIDRQRVLRELHHIVLIQSYWRCWLTRSDFLYQREEIIKIQSHWRCWLTRRDFLYQKEAAIKIQSHWRCWLMRRDFLYQRGAIIKIQRGLLCLKYRKAFKQCQQATTDIQRFARGHIARNKLLGASFLHSGSLDQITSRCMQSLELKFLLYSVLKLQRWWKRVLLSNSRTRSAIIIQSHIRGWIARRGARRDRHCIVVIQSYFRGYLVRKGSRAQLRDLHLRVQKSAANVGNDEQLMNHLVAVLPELLRLRSVSHVLHTCATLDMATEHSQKCCEILVAAGAVDILLKLIRSINRSAPNQEILKHALSTLRNFARYPQLARVLIHTHGSVEIIFQEFLRNKEDGYFFAADLLKNLSATKEGIKSIRDSHTLSKRLHNFVHDLETKLNKEKRSAHMATKLDRTEQRLREAVNLIKLVRFAKKD